uniref:NADH dehydrogenase subunit 6 n=1 Tax=Pseudopotamilla reniformis TaxID=279639 RepID=UPI001FAFEE63|nr:NADH dehydrogenase subunit 6 [Pseudopotamilla reniformis]ULD67134.1 NADH dehydrogenase subunit 6 [Pseudopotamilla reniformis]
MSSTAILLITITITLLTASASNPIAMGGLIIIQAALASIMLMSLASSWFSMMLFIIYVGGLLVMFSYFIALGPNQHLYLLPDLICLFIMYLPLFIGFTKWPMKMPIINTFLATPQPPLAIYTPENFWVLILLVITLFFALILVVKISNRSAGPLRPFD